MHKIHTSLAALTSALLIAAPLPILAQTDASFAGGAARVIVKLKADSPLLPKTAISGTVQRPRHAKTFGDRLGMTMADGEALSERSQVVFASGITSAELAQRLARQADVEYAVPDERRHVLTAPNDPLYANGVPGTGPAVGQWYLSAERHPRLVDQHRACLEHHARKPGRGGRRPRYRRAFRSP